MPVTELRSQRQKIVRFYLFISYVQPNDSFWKSKIYSLVRPQKIYVVLDVVFNPLNTELNPICQ